MRHQPPVVDRVAGESAAEVVVHAARCHGVERRGDHGQQAGVAVAMMGSQQQVEVHRRRELRRTAESSPLGVEVVGQGPGGGIHEVVGRWAAHHLDRAHRVQHRGQSSGLLVELGAAMGPCVGDGVEQLDERWHAVAGHGRKVRAAEEGAPVGVEEHRHRPAAATGERLHGAHVDGVDIGAFLAVDLHVHEVLVHDGGGGLVLEGLVRHHVAPVARRVADRQQDRDVAATGLGEGLVAPGKPVAPGCRAC